MKIDNQQQEKLTNLAIEGLDPKSIVLNKKYPVTTEFTEEFIETMFYGVVYQTEHFNLSRAVVKRMRRIVFNLYESLPLPDGFHVVPINSTTKYIINKSGDLLRASSRTFVGQRPNADGYIMCDTSYTTTKGTLFKSERLHRLMAMTFLPKSIDTLEVNHIDGNKANNNLHNLEWCTRLENMQHAYETGLVTPHQGEMVGTSKLTEIIVKELRTKHGNGATYAALAREYEHIGISAKNIRNAVLKNSWKHVD